MTLRAALLTGEMLLALAIPARAQHGQAIALHRPAWDTAFTIQQCDAAYGAVDAVSDTATYEFRALERRDLDKLRGSLRHRCWDHALFAFFTGVHMPRFVDWVVYVDSAGHVRQALTQEREVRTMVRGQRYVWVLFFEERLTPTVELAAPAPPRRRCCLDDSSMAQTAAPQPKRAAHELKLTRRSVYYERDPFIVAGLKVVTGRLFSAMDAPATRTLADSVQELDPQPVLEGAGLYVARAVVAVPQDAEIELSVDPERGWALPGHLRGAHMSMESAGSSTFEVGIAGGVPWSRRAYRAFKVDTLVGLDRTIRPNLYLIGFWNCFPGLRPALPRHRRSLGLAWGTNIAQGGFLDELVLGLSAGRLFGGEMGLVGGIDLQKESGTLVDAKGNTLANGAQTRVLRSFWALDMRL